MYKQDFPIFQHPMNGNSLAYLDSASTTQKPNMVIQALTNYYQTMNANVHRGVYALSEMATEAYEATRSAVQAFINAKETAEIIFTRGSTEGINLIAYTWGEQQLQVGDSIVVSGLEHHSNLVPWQELCRRKKAQLRIIPLNTDTTLDISQLDQLIDKSTKLVAITQMSNAIGTIPQLEPIISQAHKVGAKVLIDGAQGVPHLGIDVQSIDCDFLVFSSHKMLGPTGVGVLYVRKEILESMPPFHYGGDMVLQVTDEQANWNDIPWKFEAGTPNIADVVAFKAALDYINAIGMEVIRAHDQKLLRYARTECQKLPFIQLYGPEDLAQTGGILSFNIQGVHPHDIGSILNNDGIAIRTGHHCAQPLMKRLNCNATARISFYIYNDEEDIDRVIESLNKVATIFKINANILHHQL